jgi:addiction module HigA family antidote
MADYNLTTTGLAEKLGVSRQTVNELLLERRAASPAMALSLPRLFGNTPEFWLNAQRAVDLWKAKRENEQEIEKIKPLQAA